MSNQIQPPSSNGARSDLELDGGAAPTSDPGGPRIAGDRRAAHGDPGAGGLGPVDVDAGAAGELDAQHHRLERRPAPPVAGGEGVEVRRERHLGLRADLQRGAGGRVRTPGVGFRFLYIELADVQRLARARQDDTGKKTDRLGFPGVECAGRNVAHALLRFRSAARRRAGAARVCCRTCSVRWRWPCACRGTGRCPAARRTAPSPTRSRPWPWPGRWPAIRGRLRC